MTADERARRLTSALDDIEAARRMLRVADRLPVRGEIMARLDRAERLLRSVRQTWRGAQ